MMLIGANNMVIKCNAGSKILGDWCKICCATYSISLEVNQWNESHCRICAILFYSVCGERPCRWNDGNIAIIFLVYLFLYWYAI